MMEFLKLFSMLPVVPLTSIIMTYYINFKRFPHLELYKSGVCVRVCVCSFFHYYSITYIIKSVTYTHSFVV